MGDLPVQTNHENSVSPKAAPPIAGTILISELITLF
jgi:hypothetical protein